MEILDDEILSTLQDDVCRPAIIEEAIRLALAELAPSSVGRERARLIQTRAAADLECERLADAIAQGGPLTALLARLQGAQERRDEADAALAALEARDSSRVDFEGLEGRLRAKLADWRGLLRRNVESGRDVLRALLVGPLVFTPIIEERRRGYAFRGTIALDRLLTGVVDLPTLVASPTGFEPVFWP